MYRTTNPEDGSQALPEPVHILVVDDHHLLRQGLRSLIGACTDFEIIGEAVDGQQACELAQQLRPDVILMDVNMPRMNGIDATRWIKTTLPRIVVIGLSVIPSIAAANEMRAAGASAYLTKEASPEDLVGAITSALSDQGGCRQ